jgi:hypothetical protein
MGSACPVKLRCSLDLLGLTAEFAPSRQHNPFQLLFECDLAVLAVKVLVKAAHRQTRETLFDLVGLNQGSLVFLYRLWGLGFAALFFVLRSAGVAFDLVEDVDMLAPGRHTLALAKTHGEGDGLAHGVHQQVEVGGEVNVGFMDKGVAALMQVLFGLFWASTWPPATTS